MQLIRYFVLVPLLLLSGLPAHAWVHGVAAAGCNYSSQGGDCGPGVYNILNNGGVADAQDVTVATTISSGSASLTVGTATFASTDCHSGAGCTGAVDKAIGVWGAGTLGASKILSTTITGFTSATQVTLGVNAGTATSGNVELPSSGVVTLINDGTEEAFVAFGTDDTVVATDTGSGLDSIPVPPGSIFALFVSGTWIAAITSTSTTTLRVLVGSGAFFG